MVIGDVDKSGVESTLPFPEARMRVWQEAYGIKDDIYQDYDMANKAKEEL